MGKSFIFIINKFSSRKSFIKKKENYIDLKRAFDRSICKKNNNLKIHFT